jgi:GT2 family glycosyltransferase
LSSDHPTAAVVIATRNRRDELARCLDALHAQSAMAPVEIVVVDDGSTPPIAAADLQDVVPVRVLHTGGDGPARARNAGARAISADVVLFTDDDTIPAPAWVAAAMDHLREHPDDVAVEGPVTSPAYDPLYAYSVQAHAPGHYWTCNIAYRAEVLERLGGFAEGIYPHPHCEDLDLAYRALEIGPIGFATEMSVVHTPREIGIMEILRRGRWAASELELARRHPHRVPRRRLPIPLPCSVALSIGHARNWQRHWRRDRARLVRSPRRLARFLTMAVGHTAAFTATALPYAWQSRRRARRDELPSYTK